MLLGVDVDDSLDCRLWYRRVMLTALTTESVQDKFRKLEPEANDRLGADKRQNNLHYR